MATLSLSFLGPPVITLDAAPVHFSSRKAVALLAYLAAEPGVHTRAELALLLWPDSDEKRARGALRYTLSIIKTELGDGLLDVDRQQIRLHPDAQTNIDLQRFHAACAAAAAEEVAAEEVAAEDAAAEEVAIAHLTEAAGLYRDDFLHGFTLRDSANFDEWQFFQTEQFRQRQTTVLTQLARLHAARREYSQAIRYGQKLAQLDPLREDVHRDLLELLLASGQTAAALRLYEDYRARLEAELGVAPGPAVQELYAQAQQPQPSHSAGHRAPDTLRPHNLTAAPSGFVGRQLEQAEVCAQLRAGECRLLTLVGPGGMGKTRLAQQVAHRLAHTPDALFPDGVFFVPLTAVTEQRSLVAAVAHALGFAFAGTKPPAAQLADFLAPKSLLLVLDNFEQLLPASELLSELLNAAPALTLLITSRARLHLYEEWLYEVAALDVPPAAVDATTADAAVLLAYSAVELFCRRARRTNPRFQPHAALPDVVRITRLVQGMPLAIELAAGWTRLLSCAEIASQIEARLDFLATEMRDVPPRHRSLRAAFTYSWQRLAHEDRQVFARLAVFMGGFDHDAVATVAGASHLVLARLLDQTMVQRLLPGPASSERLHVHEMLRQFAWDELAPDAQADVRHAHALYFAQQLAHHAPARHQAAESVALVRINTDIDNILAAWHWLVGRLATCPTRAIVTAMTQAAPMLSCFLVRQARFDEGAALFAAAVDAADAAQTAAPADLHPALASLAAEVRLRQAEQLFNLSDFARVVALTDAVLPVVRGAQHALATAETLWLAGTAHVRMGRNDDAEHLLLESLALFQAAGAENAGMLAHNGLGISYSNQGRYAEARLHYEAYLALARQYGYVRGTANALNNLGSNYARAGDYHKALDFYRQSYTLALEIGEQLIIAVALSNLGSVSRALHKYADARDFYARSLRIARAIGERRWTVANLNGLGLTLVEQGDGATAVPHLLDALDLALTTQSTPDALDALATLAVVMVEQGAREAGSRVLAGVVNHPTTMLQARERAHKALAALKPQASVANRSDAPLSVAQMVALVRGCLSQV